MKKAFSLFELSIVILIISILVVGTMGSIRLVRESRLKAARALSESSQISGIEGMVLWLDASAENVFTNSSDSTKISNNQKVKTWSDNNSASKKITFSEISSGNGPYYLTNGINNLPTLYFDGSADTTTSGKCLTIPYTATLNTTNFTTFVVTRPILQPTTAVGSTVYCNWRGGVTGYGIVKDTPTTSTNTWYLLIGTDSGGQRSTSSNLNLSQNYILSSKVSGPVSGSFTASLFVNGTSYSSSSSSYVINANNTGTIHSVGCGYGTNAYYNGYISELIIYDRALSTDERKIVEMYLSKKYAIKLSY